MPECLPIGDIAPHLPTGLLFSLLVVREVLRARARRNGSSATAKLDALHKRLDRIEDRMDRRAPQ